MRSWNDFFVCFFVRVCGMKNTGIQLDSVLLGTLDYLKKLPVTTETETAINLLTEQLNKERETLKSENF